MNYKFAVGALIACLLLSLTNTISNAQLKLVGKTTIAGNSKDLSGLSNTLVNGTPHNQFGGVSGMTYANEGNRFLLLPDRGPIDGGTEYRCRFHEVDIQLDPVTGKLNTQLITTTMLRDKQGNAFTGSLNAIKPTVDGHPLRLDPEGICVSPKGTIFISDEYGPQIYEFSRKGQLIRSIKVPSRFHVSQPHANPDEELKINQKGRVPNKGFEGLAITPDGKRLLAILQAPLIQDGGSDATNVRLLEVDLETEKSREFLYIQAKGKISLSEIVALNNNQFLVIERDSLGGKEAKVKNIFRIDLTNATDISSMDSLPADGIPTGVTPVEKTLLVDLLDPTLGLVDTFPDKVEGLALGPVLANGSRMLYVASDNDFQADKPTHIWAFSISP